MIPDVVVRKVRGKWVAALNEAAMPKLRLNRIYADILTRNRDSSNQQLAAQLQEAKWLIRNVQQRFETILRVSQAIVDRQRHFFDHGDVAMRPMVLREIAEILSLHESTISRVTTQKYMLTAARHLRAQVFLRQPRRDRHRRRGVGHRHPRADQAADRRRGPQRPAHRQPHRGPPRRAGDRRRAADHRQVPRSAADSARQPAQDDVALRASVHGVRSANKEERRMNLNLTGHHLLITPAIRDYLSTKLERVTRHFDHVIDVNVVLSVDKLQAAGQRQSAHPRQGDSRRMRRGGHVRRDRRARRQARPPGPEAQGEAQRGTGTRAVGDQAPKARRTPIARKTRSR